MTSSESENLRNESSSSSRHYSKRATKEQKEILVRQYEDGCSIRDSAEVAGIKYSTARAILVRYRKDGGEIVERRCGGKRKIKLTPEVLEKIEDMIELNPSITLATMKNKLARNGFNLSQSTIFNGLKQLKITLKIGRCEIEKMNAINTLYQRKFYAREFLAHSPEDKKMCIFIDECGFNLHLRRTKARSQKGNPAVVSLPTVRGRNVTLIAAMNNQQIIHTKIITQFNCNSEKFCIFLRELVDVLNEMGNMERSWLILDNARIHRTAEVREIVQGTSYQLKYLSPYSPMLNPIENSFSKIKLCVRNKLSEPNCNTTLVQAITSGLSTITASDCENFVAKMLSKLPCAVNCDVIR